MWGRSLFVWCAAATTLCAASVEFNRDIRPILSDKCYTCHGPDAGKRLSKLRLDSEQAAKADLGGHRAIVPGNPDQSELVRRVTQANRGLRMPPQQSGRTLSDGEIELLRRWIAEGARWQSHWSFERLEAPAVPIVQATAWPRNPIDKFILERLEKEGLQPSPEASRETLLRRVTLDLTGLPPTPAEREAFLNDRSPDAYERVVDRLLASPRYGERMAAPWLAASRYADTNGYQSDGERFMWRWRDWVIDAFNRNLPYDRFTLEQIAGDMLPGATLDQRIATGFNRNHRANGEGGVIAEEYAVEYVIDRVETMSAVFLGLTMGCARCHDHKYDPIQQKEFYRMYAYFNNIPERGRANKYGNSPPFIPAPTSEQQARLKSLEQKVSTARAQFETLSAEAKAAQRAWEGSLASSSQPQRWKKNDGLVAHLPLEGEAAGRVDKATTFDGKYFFNAGDVGNFGFYDAFTVAAWIAPESGDGPIVTRTKELAQSSGYGLYLAGGKLQFNLVLRWLDDALRVETERPLEMKSWHHVAASYDGSRSAEGVQVYVDGQPAKLTILLDDLNQNFQVKEPLRIGAGGAPDARFRGLIDDVMLWRGVLSPEEVAAVADPHPLETLAAVPAAKRAKPQLDKLRWHFLETSAPEKIRNAWNSLLAAEAELKTFSAALPTVMVMEERESRRDTFVLARGVYDRPTEKVAPGLPAFLPPLPKDAPNNRLGLARWLVDPANPLVARVAVNRFWQMLFGTGLVKSVEDFGSQGDWPSHPALLDWMAGEFTRSHWNTKALLKLIVTSATYRQSSKTPAGLVARDPENRLLARGSRVRLPAEMVRDQALALSGLLVEKIGGPSVKPYQPAGLWKELSGQDYKQDQGQNLYRRSLYTFWKRAAPPPGMMLFDSAGREACTVREVRTNTPLQALDLMNDVTYLESARVLAQRIMNEVAGGFEPRLSAMFVRVLARNPSAEEAQVLRREFQYYLDRNLSNPAAAREYVSTGETPRDEKLAVEELAAYTAMASMLFNLDETVTKE